jgi:hypothetical protein
MFQSFSLDEIYSFNPDGLVCKIEQQRKRG